VAGLANYVLFCDTESGQQNIIAAGDREQAGLLFRQAKGMIENCEELMARCTIYGSRGGTVSKSVVLNDDPSFLKVVSADADTKHGGTLHLAMIDELHVQPNRDLVDVIQTSMASANRKNPLLIYVTTADFDRESICNEMHDYACKVRDGIVNDPAFLPVIFEALRTEDWKNPEVWRKANPNLEVSVSLDYMHRECAKAQENPAYENTFKRLHLNMRTEQDVRVIPMGDFDACIEDFNEEDLRGVPCYGGLDMASVGDLASFSLVFPCEGDIWKVLSWSWCPEAKVRDRAKKRIPYDVWVKSGHLTATYGNQIDYTVIRQHIIDCRDKMGFEIHEILYDAWNAAQTVQNLQDIDGFTLQSLSQNFPMLSAPTKEFLRRIRTGRIKFKPNPLYRWSASNMTVEFQGKLSRADTLDDMLDKVPIKPSKKTSVGKIDPIAATIDAIRAAISHPEDYGASVYQSRGLLTL
jgi:phage terminase large subunit-like protein